MKVLTKWMNTIVEAWAAGDAPWAYDQDGRSVAVRVWGDAFEVGGEVAALASVIELAQSRGLSLRRPQAIKRS